MTVGKDGAMTATTTDTHEARALPPRSKSACQCATCGRAIGSADAFGRHRIGPHDGVRRCADPATRGLALDGRGVWRRATPAA